MGLRLIKPPKQEPVSLEEAKIYLKVDGEEENGLIEHFIKAARQAIEAYTGRCLIEQGWCFEINAGYASAVADDAYLEASRIRGRGGIEIPRAPFIELEGDPVLIEDHQERKISHYKLDTQGGMARIHIGSGTLHSKGFIRIQFKAGYGASREEVPAPYRQAIFMLVASAYENRSGMQEATDHPLFMNEAVLNLMRPYRILRLG